MSEQMPPGIPRSFVSDTEDDQFPSRIPVIPLRDIVLFPYLVVPISIGRDASVRALEAALPSPRKICFVAQKSPEINNPKNKDLFRVGTVSVILRMARYENEVRVLAQGLKRVKIQRLVRKQGYLEALVEPLEDDVPALDEKAALESEALVKTAHEHFQKLVGLGKNISQEMLQVAEKTDDAGQLADLVATNLELDLGQRQEILETVPDSERLRMIIRHLTKELQVLRMTTKIQSQAQKELGKAHREYILREQMKAIRRELGEEDDKASEVKEYREKLTLKRLPEEAETRALSELKRFERMHPDSAESTVVRTYLDWILNIPWLEATRDNLNIKHAQRVLNEDHYGLSDIKDRLLEFLAVKKVKDDLKGPILCFVGPPGVGKTSLGRSIARAMGRKFTRLSLGGVRDEAEIRGHRRTYVGAMPGRIVQSIRRAGSNNPVFMLDEVDKIGKDFRGDPSSALLEVLDPEQNFAFSDNYLDLPMDLRNVMFITTANLLDPIPGPLRDRMEVIQLSSYTLKEKVEISRRHLWPKQLSEHGLKRTQCRIDKRALGYLIEHYTREAGVRNMERELASVIRKVTRKVAEGEAGPFKIDKAAVIDLLGNPKFKSMSQLRRSRTGSAQGLAWTSVGGEMLIVEVSQMKGKGALTLTGHLGEVMQESARAALTYVRSHAKKLGIGDLDFSKIDMHVHVPAGAVPKDGPSAGITILVSMVSLLTDRAVPRELAMTGEVTLHGDVLPVGGLKEKILAAHRYGIREIILPEDNSDALSEVSDEVTREMKFHFFGDVGKVLDAVFNRGGSSTVKKAAKPKRKQR